MLRSGRRAPWIVSLAAWGGLLAGCAQTAATPPDREYVVEVDPILQEGAAARRAAWLLYGLARKQAHHELENARRNPAADDYLIELRARAALAEHWREERQTGGAEADPYLDRLVAIEEAGELEEHVLSAFLKPGWTIPAEHLARIDWGAVKPDPKEEAPTHAIAKPVSGPLWPTVPGEDLPDPMAFHPQRVSCTESLPALRRAIRAWEAEVDQLDGAPAAASDAAELVAVLARFRGDAAFASRGATWVAPTPYWLLFVAGFCAIEHEEYELGERWLESAVAMAPHIHTARVELTNALVFLRKFERADAILDFTISSSDDRCYLARAWRKRGYIRFEQRRLEEARAAYERSLEYDPGSELARSELDLLRREIEARGGHPDWYVPPASEQHVTVCPES